MIFDALKTGFDILSNLHILPVMSKYAAFAARQKTRFLFFLYRSVHFDHLSALPNLDFGVNLRGILRLGRHHLAFMLSSTNNPSFVEWPLDFAAINPTSSSTL